MNEKREPPTFIDPEFLLIHNFDLKTSLNAMLGFLSLMQIPQAAGQQLTKNQLFFCKKMEELIGRMAHQINEVNAWIRPPDID